MEFLNKLFGSSQKKEIDFKFISHFQKLLAFQQLFMEQYNDALAKVAGLGELRNEGFSRPTVSLNDSDDIAQYIIPALRKKATILDKMETEHQERGEPESDKFKEIYQNFTNALLVMKERAQLQLDGFSAFVNDEDVDIVMTQLDEAEVQSMDKALFILNDTIENLGLHGEGFLEINCNAFNFVRKSIGLSPLSNQQFQEIYFAGISGQPARFFNTE